MKKIVICCLSMFLLSCNSVDEKKLIGVWQLTKIEDPKITKIGETFDANFSNYMEGVTDCFLGFSYLNFYSNSDFTSRMGSVYLFGKWKYDEDSKTITLKFKDKNKEFQISYIVKDSNGDEINLVLNSENRFDDLKVKDTLNNVGGRGFSEYLKMATFYSTFKKDTYKYVDNKEDIYSLSNNIWRVKPLKPETSKEIKERLKASLNFIILYLNNVKIRDEKTLNTNAYDSFSPIEIAGNGIVLKDEDKIPLEWIEIFYNKSQALEAYKLLVEVFNQNINVKEFDRWIDLDIDLLKQVNEKIK